MHESLQTEEVAQAMKMALSGRQSSRQLVHHSDRGIQYCSTYYQGRRRESDRLANAQKVVELVRE